MGQLPLYLFSLTPYPGTIHIPILTVEYRKPDIDFDAYDALIVTSKQAVEALEAIAPEWKRLPVLCVAPKTAERVKAYGGHVLETGDGYGDDLECLILNDTEKKRWLYARPLTVASDFVTRLRSYGIDIDDAVVYETTCNTRQCPTIADEAVLAFTSPSAVACFMERYTLKPGHRIAVIGKTTAAAFSDDSRVIMPENPSLAALVELGRKLANVKPRF